jgi:hypothetical protein
MISIRNALILVITMLPGLALAHQDDWSYIWISVFEDRITAEVQLPGEELAEILGLPLTSERPLTEAETEAIALYTRDHFAIGREGMEFPFEFESIELPYIEVGEYAVIKVRFATPEPVPDRISIRYSAIFHEFPDIRGGFHVQNNYKTGLADNHRQIAHIFGPDRTTWNLNLENPVWTEQFKNFVREGVIHIWIGFDHILFLIGLLLTSVVVRDGRSWKAVPELRSSLWNVVTIVTVFTVAHSITLAMALKGWIVLPSRLVESIIALSIIAVVADNFYSIFGRWKWVVVFLFGLFHGMGFASILETFTTDFNSKLIGLIGFNIGVEIGQLVIVLAVFPLLYLVRNMNYQRLLLQPGSAAIGLVAGWWFISRAFDLNVAWTSF